MKANFNFNVQFLKAHFDKSIKTITTNNNSIIHCSKSKTFISESSDGNIDLQATYCICEKVSYGNTVCCDNDLCPIEWFHFICVLLYMKLMEIGTVQNVEELIAN